MTEDDDSKENGRSGLFWGWYVKVTTALLIPAILGAAGFSIRMYDVVSDHAARLSFIERTRFTYADWAAEKDGMMKSIPPEWLRVEIAEMKVWQHDMELRMRAIEVALAKLRD